MCCVITEPCVGVKDKACVPACPVDSIHEGDRMLYINPRECICCQACVDVCPVQAIFWIDDVPEKWESYIEENAGFFTGGPGCRCHPSGGAT